MSLIEYQGKPVPAEAIKAPNGASGGDGIFVLGTIYFLVDGVTHLVKRAWEVAADRDTDEWPVVKDDR